MARNDILREARIQRHWTQSTLAAQLNTTRVTIARWEQGQTMPSLYFRAQLCQLFGRTEQELGLDQLPAETTSSQVWLVPERRNLFFTGREATLRQLHAALCCDDENDETDGTVSAVIHLLSGLAGIGKTQVALEYAYRFRQHYAIIAWLRAQTRETLLADMLKLALALHISEAHELDEGQVVQALRAYLEKRNDWLLICDHVEDISSISHLLPVAHLEGKVLITTRIQATGQLNQLYLKEMSHEESMLFFLHRAKLLPLHCDLRRVAATEYTLAAQLCQEFGGLPLAIEQAGSYIEETGCSIAGYLERLKCRRTALLSWCSQQSNGYASSVVATLRIARERVECQSLVASELLSLCLFLHPNALPETVITSSAMHLGEPIREAVHDLISLDKAFAVLNASSLLRRDPETHLLMMHRLMQTVLRDQLEAETQRLWAERALQALLHLFPASPHHEEALWPLCDLLLPHIICCIGHIEDLVWDERQTHLTTLSSTLLLKAADYLLERARYREAESFLTRALHLLETTLGPGYSLLDYLPPNRVLFYKVLGEYPQTGELFQDIFTRGIQMTQHLARSVLPIERKAPSFRHGDESKSFSSGLSGVATP